MCVLKSLLLYYTRGNQIPIHKIFYKFIFFDLENHHSQEIKSLIYFI